MKKIKLIKTTHMRSKLLSVNGIVKNVEKEVDKHFYNDRDIVLKINELVSAVNLLIDNTFH